jgi:hypothetical protein
MVTLQKTYEHPRSGLELKRQILEVWSTGPYGPERPGSVVWEMIFVFLL